MDLRGLGMPLFRKASAHAESGRFLLAGFPLGIDERGRVREGEKGFPPYMEKVPPSADPREANR